ncbi:hypothetical protein FA95DRAFT_1122827 [Auriscalpium vulgare]|uniref:Uncharacterized protein n=1 Tax=Auriscalpium vulgare TaxID=40419 RepID=A0ACB8R4W7_9AGAM|nr:hypothetical protein FA95DRAFT_1122827 [Auriscalpium vulgare]
MHSPHRSSSERRPLSTLPQRCALRGRPCRLSIDLHAFSLVRRLYPNLYELSLTRLHIASISHMHTAPASSTIFGASRAQQYVNASTSRHRQGLRLPSAVSVICAIAGRATRRSPRDARTPFHAAMMLWMGASTAGAYRMPRPEAGVAVRDFQPESYTWW